MLVLAALLLCGLGTSATSGAETEPDCSSAPNPIVCENALPGDAPKNWQLEGVGDPSIQGFATSMSVNAGQTELFKIKTPASAYHIEILRLGYYGGNGARLIASGITPTASLPQTQPECLHEAATGLIDCGNWGVSAQWTVPSTAVSGVYIALLTREDTGGKSQVTFVVRNDAGHSKILLQTSDATWEAYNAYGGNSLYTCTVSCPSGSPKAYKPAYAVSYNRPFDGALTTDNGASYIYYAEYQMIRFLEKNGYDISYTTSGDVDRSAALLKNHKVFMSSGHDEYWSAGQRANVEAAREAGVNLAFFSANELFWKTRWGPSIDGGETPYRTLTSYKETHFEGPADPKDPSTWTGAWRDPRGGPAADGGKPENTLSGQQFEVNAGTSEITVPSSYSKLRLWRNTTVAGLAPGQTLTLAPDVGTLGYEWDEDVDNGFRPAGEFDLSSTTVSGVQAFIDYGTSLNGTATATHHLTLYRAPSGALVFGAGTVQWSWGLDNTNAWGVGSTDPEHPPVDLNVEQFTVNLLAEMGAAPATLASGLVAPTPSTDTTPPSSTITAPSSEETLQDGTRITITGTASDAGGGVVAGVEVSTDNGTTWHPASLTTPVEQTLSWSYSWTAHGYPTTTIKSRAVDDSSNLETPSAGVQVKVVCPCSIWGQGVTPPIADSGDAHPVELGVKFTTETFGVISGVRFYKSAANTGTHIGSLWSSTGQRLATATFSGESGSGWQQVNFSTPVDVFPNTTYIASYFTPTGHYAASSYYFYTPPATGGSALNAAPLHALPANAPPSGATYGSLNGLFSYGSASSFPTNSFAGSNYWVDPVFTPVPAPGQVTNVTASSGSLSAMVSWSAPATGGPVTTYTITPYIGAEAQPATTVTGTPPVTSTTVAGLKGGTAYTFTVRASNPIGAGATSAPSGPVTPTTLAPPSPPTAVSAIAASSQALVSWTAPVNNGGSTITGYTITPYIGANAQTPLEIGPGSTSDTVKNLTNGTSYTFTVAATNALGIGLASSPSNAITPQDTIFDFATPATIDSGDASATNVGVKFTSLLAGTVTGIRFYKSAANTGTHVGSLWSSTGTLLAQATFTSETATGWQQVNFSSPVQITANTTYVASYLAPKGHYSDTSSGFASTAVNNPPLTALANTTSANGVYMYNAKTTFPTNNFKATNYWVDVDFEPMAVPGQVTNVSATAGNGTATLTWSAPSSGGPVTSYIITPYVGGEAKKATTITGAPPVTGTTIGGLIDGVSYTFTVQAANANGSGSASAPSNAVLPSAPTAPSAPTGVSATAATGQALVSWTEPSENSGSAISGYTITPFIGATPQTPVEAPAGATSGLVSGLANGTAYTFTVTATNAIGSGPSSSPSAAITPQATIFDFANPATVDSGDASPTEVGVKFSSEALGNVTGIRFYKSAANTGTHVGSLWSSSGTLLASATFTNETASGWQQVNFSSPVLISPNTTYVAAYLAPGGHYSDTAGGFAFGGVSKPPLLALANTTSANGVFAHSATSTFPNIGGGATNYWVDADFEPVPAPGTVTNVSATAGHGAAGLTWNAPTSGGPVTSYTITPYIGSEAQPTTTITGTPPATGTTITGLTNATSYTFTVQASNPNGSGPPSAQSNPVTPTAVTAPSAPTAVTASAATSQAQVSWSAPASNGGSPITSYTVTPFIGANAQTAVEAGPGATSTTVKGLTNGTSYTFTVTATNAVGGGPASSASNAVTPQDTIFDFGAPTTVDSGDSASTVVGVKFSSEALGNVTGIRFYKSAANTGTHVGSLWSSSGTLLASATFTSETATGWQQVNFNSPVQITPNTTYVASYLAPKGHYSDNVSGFAASGVSNPPLAALSNTVSANGVFAHSATSVFPSSTSSATNYWVDVDFEASPPPGQATGVSATAGNGSAGLTWTAPAEGGPVTSYTITPYIGSEAQPTTTIPGTPPATGTTITGLTNGTSYTFTVTATNANGSGPASPQSNAVTPVTTPSAPSGVTATAAEASASVKWSAPNNGGSTITSYTITPYIGSTAQTATTITGTPPATGTTVTGLTNGTSYTFTVTATNSVGTGPASEASNTITPSSLTAPAAPSGVTASAGNASASVKWSAPNNGGSTITSYTITPYIGSTAQTATTITGTPPATEAKITGLTNGTSYTFTVTATNSVGTGPASEASNAITPATTPSAPSGVTASTGNASATVKWTAPGNGGSTITSYTITPFIGSTAQTATTITGTPPATEAKITGLTNGTSYSFTVTATNSVGTGPASEASNTITPTSANPPSAPSGVTASAATSQALLSWTAPSNNGGSSITSYTITPFIGAQAQAAIQTGTSATSTIVTGLVNGTAYSFTVAATNVAGTGTASTASAPVTPQDTIMDFTTPVTLDSTDTHSTVLGVKFSSEVAGSVTGVRFYKASTNTGTHVASLWTGTGTLLATATYANETASGWQQVNFSSPVAITANTTYVAAYLAPKGHYSDTSAAFTTVGITNPPLSALANPITANGVYVYSSTSSFPTSTFKATNYLVDVDFAPSH